MTPTISNNLSVLETIYVAHIMRPFSTRKAVEIVAAPKVYGFDSFVCYFRGWQQPRPDDLDLLWEHYVLNELHALCKSGARTIDVTSVGTRLTSGSRAAATPPVANECKWSAENF